MEGISVAGGTVPGTNHTRPGMPLWTNNQDAYGWRNEQNVFVAIVCDGCSGSPHSEVGAKIGLQIILRRACEMFAVWPDALSALSMLAETAANDLLSFVVDMVGLSPDYEKVLSEYFLFTVIGVAIMPEETIVFSFGDGVYAINGETMVIPQSAGNAPPYLAYLRMKIPQRKDLSFVVRARMQTNDLQSVLIGSDGVVDYIATEGMLLPGGKGRLESLSEFWTNDRVFENPDLVRRRLAMANREWAEEGQVRHGLLPDDTTLVVVRRNISKRGEEG